jgi:acyl carrier protein
MANAIDKEQIVEVIRNNISEALLVPLDRVVSSARIISDLSAESIDVADIRFRLEEKLGVRIDQRAMAAALGQTISAAELDEKFTVQFVIDYTIDQLTKRA